MSEHKNERDPVTGQITTGHDWNGIKELNSPVPKIVFAALILGVIYVVISTVLLPAWPSINGYTKGLLGIDQRSEVEQQVAQAQAGRADWVEALSSQPLDALARDPQIMDVVRETGARLFGDNCLACHSDGGTGQTGYPNIAQAPLMWGEDIDTIEQTIRVGINSGHPDSRFAQMPAFGADGMLPRSDVLVLTDYLQAMSTEDTPDAEIPEDGAQMFANNCSGCHGADGTGVSDVGAPNLIDPHWIYGDTRADIFQSIFFGRQGHMPHWEGRLSDTDIKILALYVHDLRTNPQ